LPIVATVLIVTSERFVGEVCKLFRCADALRFEKRQGAPIITIDLMILMILSRFFWRLCARMNRPLL